MKQKRLVTIPELIEAGVRASGGATETAATITLVLNTKVTIDSDTAALIEARNLHVVANAELKGRKAVLKSLKAASREYIAAVRDTLKRTLGTRISPAWDTTGFVGSFEIPTTMAGLKDRLHALKTFLTNNPALEFPAFDVTAARATILLDELIASDVGLNAHKAIVGTALDTRRKKETALRRRLSGLVNELGQQIDPLDQRWTAFGLNKPGAKETPEIPTDVVVTLIGSTAAAIKWPKSARADHYRVCLKIKGIDEGFVEKGRPVDPDFTLEGLPSNAAVEIAISAVNNGGESALSEVMTFVASPMALTAQ